MFRVSVGVGVRYAPIRRCNHHRQIDKLQVRFFTKKVDGQKPGSEKKRFSWRNIVVSAPFSAFFSILSFIGLTN